MPTVIAPIASIDEQALGGNTSQSSARRSSFQLKDE
jgi:hypothetical protein